MKVSYRWLQEYVKTGLNPTELGDKFRLTSSEIEGLEEWGSRFQGLVIGKVLEVSKHPNADKLRLAKVNIGAKTPSAIVCGAPNLRVGQTVVVALPGAVLHPVKGEAFTISATVIRGEPSEGMLCAADEIGLPFPSAGILDLPDTLAAGSSVAEALFLNDTVLDLEITPNRPDLLSYIGLAREVGAFEKKRITEPALLTTSEAALGHDIRLSVEIEDADLCHRCIAIVLRLPGIGTSPQWMQSRLLLSGIRPINAAVDITNYVMLEYGQPLHAFDLSTVGGRGIRVRSARNKEAIVTLDGVSRVLEAGDIVIADNADKLLDVAGIMGGDETGVSDGTTEILLVSSVFHGPQIRRTSRRLGLRSEASTRFEKGLDSELAMTALKRAAYLFQEVCSATVSSETYDRYPGKTRTERPRIHLSFARIQEITGVHISAAEAKGILQHLGFQISSLTKSSFDTTPPSWRRDVSLPEDVVEELIRIWGVERLPSTMPTGGVKPPDSNPFFKKKSLIRHSLAGMGMHECVHLTFASGAEYARLGLPTDPAIRLQNPLSSQTEFLITTHAIPLLGNLGSTNLQQSEVSLFEIGHVFSAPRTEIERLSLVQRSSRDIEETYRLTKAALNRLAHQLRLPEPTYAPGASLPFAEACLEVRIGTKKVGIMGGVTEDVISRLKIRSGKNVVYAELDLDALLAIPGGQRLYAPIGAYPAIQRDITLVLARSRQIAEIEEILKAERGELLTAWQVTDIYAGKPLDAAAKSVTVRLTYSSPERTLEDQEASLHLNHLAAIFRTKLEATISQ